MCGRCHRLNYGRGHSCRGCRQGISEAPHRWTGQDIEEVPLRASVGYYHKGREYNAKGAGRKFCGIVTAKWLVDEEEMEECFMGHDGSVVVGGKDGKDGGFGKGGFNGKSNGDGGKDGGSDLDSSAGKGMMPGVSQDPFGDKGNGKDDGFSGGKGFGKDESPAGGKGMSPGFGKPHLTGNSKGSGKGDSRRRILVEAWPVKVRLTHDRQFYGKGKGKGAGVSSNPSTSSNPTPEDGNGNATGGSTTNSPNEKGADPANPDNTTPIQREADSKPPERRMRRIQQIEELGVKFPVYWLTTETSALAKFCIGCPVDLGVIGNVGGIHEGVDVRRNTK